MSEHRPDSPKGAENLEAVTGHGRNALLEPVCLAFPDGRKLLVKVDVFLLANGYCAIGGWLSDEVEIVIEADSKILPHTSVEIFPRPDVNRHLGTDSARRHGFAVWGQCAEPDSVNLVVGVNSTKFRLGLDIKKAEKTFRPGLEAVLGSKFGELACVGEKTSSGCKFEIRPENSPINCGIDHVLRWPDSAIGSPIIISGWATMPDQAVLLAGYPEGTQFFAPDICWFSRPDIILKNDIFINKSRVGNGFIFALKNYGGTQRDVALFIQNETIKFKGEQAKVKDIYNFRKFIKAVFEIDIETIDMARTYRDALMPVFKDIQKIRNSAITDSRHKEKHLGNTPEKPSLSVIRSSIHNPARFQKR